MTQEYIDMDTFPGPANATKVVDGILYVKTENCGRIKKMSLLSIVLPAYNEEQNIANTAKGTGGTVDQHGIDYEAGIYQ